MNTLLHDIRSGTLDNKTVLFRNTLNSREFSKAIDDIGYHELPPEFQVYFQD